MISVGPQQDYKLRPSQYEACVIHWDVCCKKWLQESFSNILLSSINHNFASSAKSLFCHHRRYNMHSSGKSNKAIILKPPHPKDIINPA